MKKLIFLLSLLAFNSFGAGEPIQRSIWTTNVAGASINGSVLTNIPLATGVSGTLATNNGGTGSATGSGNALTNISLADGGILSNNRDALGSTSGMNPNGLGWLMYVNGASSLYGAAGDNALIIEDLSTNFLDNSGLGVAVMGYGSSGATVLGLSQGPTLTHIPTNKTETFMNSGSSIVMNYDSVNDKWFAIIAPAAGLSGSDAGNYAGLFVDWEHHLTGVPLVPGGNTNGGCYQPDDVVYDFTVSGITVAPPFPSGYKTANGRIFTAYSNNVANTHVFMVGNLGAPDASGNLTKISTTTTGDSTIAYSAVVANRTWNGWTATMDWQAGNVAAYGSMVISNGSYQTKKSVVQQNGVNLFSTTSNINYAFGNGSGMTEQLSRGVDSAVFGTSVAYFMAGTSAAQGWFGSAASPQVTIGGNELDDFFNIGSSTLEVHGSIGSMITNYPSNKTLTVDDSTALMTGSGSITATLPDATGNLGTNAAHGKYRIYQIKNLSTTNSLVATTSSETIDGKTGYTNAPNETIQVQSDGTNWQILSTYGGAPTNFSAITTAGFTNTWNWPAVAYVDGAAVVFTNFDGAGQAYLTNTNVSGGLITIYMQPGAKIVAAAAAGLAGTVHAIGR